MKREWNSLYPDDWCVAGCPENEIGYLHDYEFSRESAWIQEQVDFIRHGRIKKRVRIKKNRTYWQPNPSFGWPEWPAQSYLSIPASERAARLEKLLSTDDLIVAPLQFPIPSAAGGDMQSFLVQFSPDDELSLEEARESILARLRGQSPNKPMRPVRKGRAAAAAQRRARVWALCAARVRDLCSSGVALEKFNGAHQETGFSDRRSMRRSAGRAHEYLTAFEQRAKDQISRGVWMPPFGRTLVSV